MPATVDPRLPLSLLEAVRFIDTPQDDFEAEFVDELRNKRLGLSDTVYAQIGRYSEAIRRRQKFEQEEAVALARLIGRRPDAEAVFRSAGRHLAREAYLTLSAPTRRMLLLLPGLLARPYALRCARRLVRHYFRGSIVRVGGHVLMEVPVSVTLNVAPRETGCAYYEAFFRELLRLLVGGVGAAEHVRCAGRAEGNCQWRAEWRRAGKDVTETTDT